MPSSFLKRIVKGTLNGVRKWDSYGKNVFIAHNNDENYKTQFGGFVSISILLALLFYAGFLLKNMIERNTVTYSTNTVVNDLSKTTADHKPAEHGFTIAVGLRDDSTSFLDEEYLKYYELQINQYESTQLENGTFINELKALEFEKWGDNFPFEDQDLIKKYYIDRYVWIKSNNFTITGNRYSDSLKALLIEFRKCDPSKRSDWETDDSVVANHLSNQYVDILMIDSYFDSHSFDNPVKSYLTQKYFYQMSTTKYKNVLLFLKENNVDVQDSFIGADDVGNLGNLNGNIEISLTYNKLIKPQILELKIKVDRKQIIYKDWCWLEF